MNGFMRRVARAALLGVAAALLLALGGAAWADGPSRAGLVIVNGPDDVRTTCVPFDAAEVSGLELLQRAGLAVIQAGTTGVGDTVCKIDAVGCDYPGEHCFCRCLSTPCTFWSYWYWQDGDWAFSQRGAASRRVSDGAVEAWVWGDGQTRPPALDVASICAPPQLSAPASQDSYPGPDDTTQPQPTTDPYPGPDDGEPEPTPEAEPTATPEPEPTEEAPVETPTPAEQTATPEPEATGTAAPTPSATPTRATPTATPATPSPTPGPSATPTDDGMAAAIATAVARNRGVPVASAGGSGVGGYIAFALLALVLGALLVYAVLLRRQRARVAAE